MISSFNDLSMIQYNDGITVSDGRKSMGDHKYSTAFHQVIHTFCTILSVRVSILEVASSRISTGGLATAALAMERSCLCPWDNSFTVSAYHSVVTVWKHFDKLVCMSQFCCLVYLLVCCIQITVTDIVFDSSCKQVCIL